MKFVMISSLFLISTLSWGLCMQHMEAPLECKSAKKVLKGLQSSLDDAFSDHQEAVQKYDDERDKAIDRLLQKFNLMSQSLMAAESEVAQTHKKLTAINSQVEKAQQQRDNACKVSVHCSNGFKS